VDDIITFDNEYDFLSNFYFSDIIFNKTVYRTSEHMFQSFKATNKEDKLTIINKKTPGQAKRAARHIKIVKNWDDIKYKVMLSILKLKFNQNNTIKQKLINTGDLILIEGNHWHDNYWGNCFCKKCINKNGQNNLGRILMYIRRSLD